MLKAWMRDLQVILSSSLTKKQLIFGQEWKKGRDDLAISIEGSKYLSSMLRNMNHWLWGVGSSLENHPH